MQNTQTITRVLLLLLTLTPVLSASAQLANPRLRTLFPSAGQIGTTFDVNILSASDFDEAKGLQFSHPGITAKLKPEYQNPALPEPIHSWNLYEVTINKDVPPGVYEVRQLSRFGLTTARHFVVRPTPVHTQHSHPIDSAKPFALAPNNSAFAFINPESYHYYSFQAKKGERLTIELLARRIDSRLQGVVNIFDSAGRELKVGRLKKDLDPLVDFLAPQDDTYTIRVNDLTFRGNPEYYYELKLHTTPFIHAIHPPMGLPGQKQKVTLYGRNLPGSTPAEHLKIGDQPLEKIELEIQIPQQQSLNTAGGLGFRAHQTESQYDTFIYRWNASSGLSNAVRMSFASAPVTLEDQTTPTNTDQTITIPTEVAGRFYPRADVDTYIFNGKKGQPLRIEVISHRLGHNLDASMLIQIVRKDDKGNTTYQDLAYLDDSRNGFGGEKYSAYTTDPIHSFTLPEDAQYRIVLRDMGSAVKDNPTKQYRLILRNPQPDFIPIALPTPLDFPGEKVTKHIVPWANIVRRGSAERIDIMLLRKEGFTGPVTISPKDLPPGLTVPDVHIPGYASSGSVVIYANPDAPVYHGPLKLIATAKHGEHQIQHQIIGAEIIHQMQVNNTMPLSRTTDLMLSVIDSETLPFALKIETQPNLQVHKGGKLQIPVKLERRNGWNGKVTVSAYTPHGEIKINNGAIEPGKDQFTFEIAPTPKAPLGQYTFYVIADTVIDYRRNPETLAKYNALKKHVEEKQKQAQAKLAEAQKQLNETNGKIEPLKTQIAQLTQKLSTLKPDATDRPETQKALDQHNATLQTHTKQIESANATIAASNDMLNHAKNALTFINGKIKQVTPWNNVVKPRFQTPAINVIHINVTDPPPPPAKK